MRILAVDHGGARIGIALSDATGAIARPLQIIAHTARQAEAEAVARIAAEHGAEKIVVGLPTDGSGQIGHQARKVQRWAEALRAATSLPVEFWDESFSSAEANRLPTRRKRREPADAQAAAFILQSYLDSHRLNSTPDT